MFPDELPSSLRKLVPVFHYILFHFAQLFSFEFLKSLHSEQHLFLFGILSDNSLKLVTIFQQSLRVPHYSFHKAFALFQLKSVQNVEFQCFTHNHWFCLSCHVSENRKSEFPRSSGSVELRAIQTHLFVVRIQYNSLFRKGNVGRQSQIHATRSCVGLHRRYSQFIVHSVN